MDGKTPLEARAYSELGQEIAHKLETMRKPTIAAVNGYALGGGCEMALACDIRLASTNAQFGQPEINLGIIPGWGGTQRLARATNIGYAKELILTGRMVDAAEALERGLVQHVYAPEELMPRTMELAQRWPSRARSRSPTPRRRPTARCTATSAATSSTRSTCTHSCSRRRTPGGPAGVRREAQADLRRQVVASIRIEEARNVKIAVCVKEVPSATSAKRIDPATKRLDRSGDSELNPFDMHGLEEAIRIREGGQPRWARSSPSAWARETRSGRWPRRWRWAPTAPCC